MKVVPAQRSQGLSRIEVLALILSAFFLTALVLGMGARIKSKRNLTQCQRNQKEIVLGFIEWIVDTDSKYLPWQTPVDRGGTKGFSPASLATNCWFQFAWISNYLSSPRVLADPADKRLGLRVARSWNADPKGGIAHPQYQNNACSYGLGVEGCIGGPNVLPLDMPDPILVIDRHVSNFEKSTRCWFKLGVLAAFREPFMLEWTNEVHGAAGGNVGRFGGDSEYVSSKRLNESLICNWDALDGAAHFLLPFSRE